MRTAFCLFMAILVSFSPGDNSAEVAVWCAAAMICNAIAARKS